MRRTTEQKLAIFKACFSGLKHVYGTYDPRTGQVRQVKQPVTDQVLLNHLQGRQPYGVYLLAQDRTLAVVADFDNHDRWPVMQFIQQANHYNIPVYIECSKGKGYHAWIFAMGSGVTASKARLVVQNILDDIDQSRTEVFPKQDHLNSKTQFGNFINAPLFGTLVPKGRTVFIDHRSFEPMPNQWDLLQNVQRISDKQLDEIIELNELGESDDCPPLSTPENNKKQCEEGRWPMGLPPCAQKMLAVGVQAYQRVACFRLAVQLKKAGMPMDLAITVLQQWATKNQPKQGKQIITCDEIQQQTRYAYEHHYTGCGCEEPAILPFCQSSCPLHSRQKGKDSNKSVNIKGGQGGRGGQGGQKPYSSKPVGTTTSKRK